MPLPNACNCFLLQSFETMSGLNNTLSFRCPLQFPPALSEIFSGGGEHLEIILIVLKMARPTNGRTRMAKGHTGRVGKKHQEHHTETPGNEPRARPFRLFLEWSTWYRLRTPTIPKMSTSSDLPRLLVGVTRGLGPGTEENRTVQYAESARLARREYIRPKTCQQSSP